MKSAYLIIVLLSLAGPLSLSFDRKVAFYRLWRFLPVSILLPAAIYLIWDMVFTRLGIWEFNKDFVLGLYLINLPFEEILFFLIVPYCCLFIYECIRVYFPKLKVRIGSIVAGWILVLLAAWCTLHYYDRLYTAVTGILLFITLINQLLISKNDYFQYILLSWLISVIPMFAVNGFLTGLPILSYNASHFIGYRIGPIPAEDFFYNLLFMLWMIPLFEKLRARRTARIVRKETVLSA